MLRMKVVLLMFELSRMNLDGSLGKISVNNKICRICKSSNYRTEFMVQYLSRGHRDLKGQRPKICEGLLPDNGRLQHHFWFNSLNFDARSILTT